jgi:small subunit ribosomal protein S17e
MGRIKTRLAKAVTFDLMESYKEEFSKDYAKNKTKVEDLTDVKSKKLRNVIAGYVTRIKKSEN